MHLPNKSTWDESFSSHHAKTLPSTFHNSNLDRTAPPCPSSMAGSIAPATAATPANSQNKTKKTCVICWEAHETDQLLRPCRACTNTWCAACLESSFRTAIDQKSGFSPPTCHGIIQLHTILGRLEKEFADKYRAAFEEWLTKDRVYCPVPTCSAFIPERHMHASGSSGSRPTSFLCPTCKSNVCTSCHQTAHEGSCDTLAKKEDEAMLAKFKIKQCPRCRRAVRKMYGCSEMACLCGAHFCYVCLMSIDQCDGSCGADQESDGGEDSESQTSESESSEDSEDEDKDADVEVHDEVRKGNDTEKAANEGMQESKEEQGRPGQPEKTDNAESISNGLTLPPRPPLTVPVLTNEILTTAYTQQMFDDMFSSIRRHSQNIPRPASMNETKDSNSADGSTSIRRHTESILLPASSNETRASNSPNGSTSIDLDAGGEVRWGMNGDFGPEPEEADSVQVWSCKHRFDKFRRLSGLEYDGCRCGDLDLMECNRCFTKVQAAPEESKRKRRRTGKHAHLKTSGEDDEQNSRPLQAFECRDCKLVVCRACRAKYKSEQGDK